MTHMRTGSALALISLLAAVACDEGDPYVVGDGGVAQGQKCALSAECRTGLVCSGFGVCAKPGEKGTGAVGKPCAGYADCQRDFTCDTAKFSCVKPGKGAAGDACKGHQDCGKQLVCSSKLTCAKIGTPGAAPDGDACKANTDCVLGLVCVADTCVSPVFWKGGSCGTPSGAFRALFRIPRKGTKEDEFYSLPFPNDIRLKGGRVDVTGHPDPAGVLPAQYKDVVTNIYKAINSDVTGFGPNAAVFLRMSHAFDLNTLTLIGLKPTVQFLNIQQGATNYGKGVGMSMFATTGRGKYICHNTVAVRPNIGSPLETGTTYAVLLYKGIKTKDGKQAVQDDDFKKMLQAGEPMAAEEKAAWQAYKPLRAYLKDKNIDSSTVVSAAVFTTMKPRARMAQLRQQIHDKMTAPVAVKDLTICDGKLTSPCDDAKTKTHKCPASPNSAFDELQGSIEVPVMQQGTRPYKKPADGGTIAWEKDGKPKIQSTEKLCFAMTVPKGKTMPKDGWPVVIYAHGTGGHFRGYIGDGTAQRLTTVGQTGGAKEASFATIGIDGALHGPRRGSTDKPDELFFNLLNPRAARDNVYQGAADKFQLVRLLKNLKLDAKASPTGKEVKFDTSRIYYFGHSQGTVEGLPFLAFEPDVAGAVLSGAGGYLIGSLLEKTKPTNISGQVRLVLADPYVGTTHPLLNLLQLLYEEVDGVNYGKALFTKPEDKVTPKHVFLSKGVADSYTPPGTTDALAWAAGMRQVKQDAQRCGDGRCTGNESCKSCDKDCKKCPHSAACGDGKCGSGETCRNCPDDCTTCPARFSTDTPPVKGNIYKSGAVKYTVGLVEYASDGTYDDHFVISRNPAAKAQSTQFLGSAVWDDKGVPTIPQKQ